MFAIYGTSGLVYRGPLEDFRKVAPSLRTARIRALMVEADRDPLAAATEPVSATPSRGATGAPPALQAYAEVQRPAVVRRPLYRVDDVWTAPATSVALASTIEAAWQVLATQGIGQAPVVDAQQRLVGLLTRAELMRADRLPAPDAHPLVWRAWLEQPVAEAMVSPVPSVTPDTELRRLALLLLDTGLPGVPVVVDDGVVEGFVSRSDILKAVVHEPPLDLWAG